MKKEDILKAIIGIKEGMSLDETSSKILESLKNMNQLERVETLCEIIDEPEIDLDSEIMNEILANYRSELVALREANSFAKKDNTNDLDVSAETTSTKAVELLTSK